MIHKKGTENEVTLNITLDNQYNPDVKNRFLEGIKYKINLKGLVEGNDKLEHKRIGSMIRIKNLKKLTLPLEQANDDTAQLQVDVIYQGQKKSVTISLNDLKQSLKKIAEVNLFKSSEFFKEENMENFLKAHQYELEKKGRGLIFAAENGHLEIVKYLIEKGKAKVDKEALNLANIKNNEEIIELVTDSTSPKLDQYT